LAISSNEEPKSYHEAAMVLEWQEAMLKEIETLKQNQTWIVIYLPQGKQQLDVNGFLE